MTQTNLIYELNKKGRIMTKRTFNKNFKTVHQIEGNAFKKIKNTKFPKYLMEYRGIDEMPVINETENKYFFFSFNGRDSNVFVDRLIIEMEYILEHYTKTTLFGYIHFRYGLQKFDISTSQICEFDNVLEVVFFLLCLRNKKSNKVCLLESKKVEQELLVSFKSEKQQDIQNPFNPFYMITDNAWIFTGVKVFQESNDKSLSNLYKDAFASATQIKPVPTSVTETSTKPVPLKTTRTQISIQSFISLLEVVGDITDKSFLKFILGSNVIDELKIKTIDLTLPATRKLIKNHLSNMGVTEVINPEVFKVINATNPYLTFLSNETVVDTRDENYKVHKKKNNITNICSKIRGVCNSTIIESKCKRDVAQIKELNIANANIDPFLEKSQYLCGNIAPMYSLNIESFKAAVHMAKNNMLDSKFVNKDDAQLEAMFHDLIFNEVSEQNEFQKYVNSVELSARDTFCISFNAFPKKVWDAFLFPVHKKHPFSSSESTCIVSALEVIPLEQEYYIYLLKETLSYTINTPDIHNELLNSAQILVSIAIQKKKTLRYSAAEFPIKRISGTKMHITPEKKTIPFYLKFQSYFQRVKKVHAISWDQVKAFNSSKMPMFFSYLSTEALALVAGHHDFADRMFTSTSLDLKNKVLLSGLTYDWYHYEDYKYSEDKIRDRYTFITVPRNYEQKISAYNSKTALSPFAPKTLGYSKSLRQWIIKRRQKVASDLDFITSCDFIMGKIKLSDLILDDLEYQEQDSNRKKKHSVRVQQKEFKKEAKEIKENLDAIKAESSITDLYENTEYLALKTKQLDIQEKYRKNLPLLATARSRTKMEQQVKNSAHSIALSNSVDETCKNTLKHLRGKMQGAQFVTEDMEKNSNSKLFEILNTAVHTDMHTARNDSEVGNMSQEEKDKFKAEIFSRNGEEIIDLYLWYARMHYGFEYSVKDVLVSITSTGTTMDKAKMLLPYTVSSRRSQSKTNYVAQHKGKTQHFFDESITYFSRLYQTFVLDITFKPRNSYNNLDVLKAVLEIMSQAIDLRIRAEYDAKQPSKVNIDLFIPEEKDSEQDKVIQ